MSREIRRVPPNWEHPRNEKGSYIPLYDQDYETAAKEWEAERAAWDDGTHEDLVRSPKLKQKYPYYWEWNGNPPNPEYYRQPFTEEPTHYQIYETVSEGTPTSPVFKSLEEMKDWLLSQGYSENAASMFIEDGWAPSMVFAPDKGVSGLGIHSLDFL